MENISLSVRAGEILGMAGLQGSGASELLLTLFGGSNRIVRGKARLNGKDLAISCPAAAIEQGIALLTNDRKATGLVLSLSVVANITLAALPRLSRGGWRRPKIEKRAALSLCRKLSLRAESIDAEMNQLSGGNQQKAVLAKWLQTEPQLLLLDEPTRGIDVGAKREIYRFLDSLTGMGIAILLITSELPELLALSDRIIVMHRGRLTAEFTRLEASAAGILSAAMGVHAEQLS